ncbi:MAG: hypothetical protein KA712_24265 [Myxococcales bacterium]|nr:hypothetical protein [Myxococcales bacterium]
MIRVNPLLFCAIVASCASSDEDLTDNADARPAERPTEMGGPGVDAAPAMTGTEPPEGGLPQAPIDASPAPDGAKPPTPGAQTVPSEKAALIAYLQSGAYETLPAEPAAHPSTGPHFGLVRTFFNQALADSLAQGNSVHPVGAAAVKELFRQGSTVRGWAVMVKVAEGSGGGSWYWYEGIDGTEFAASTGAGLCTGCHGAGRDFVLTPPL